MPNIQKQTFDFSNPDLYNSVYIPLFENKARFLHLVGSAGSGKSVFEFQKEIALTFDYRRKGRKTLVIREYYSTLKNSCYNQIKSLINDWNIQQYFTFTVSPLSVINKLTEVEFIFLGLDDPEKVKSISGADRIVIEEATDIKSRDKLDQLSLRLRGFEEVQITLMYNPISVNHWLKKEIHDKLPDDHFILKTTYKDNKFLDKNYVKTLEDFAKTNPNYYKIYAQGEWGQKLEGLIFPEYDTVPEFPDIDFCYGLDFGFNHPTAMVKTGVIDKEVKELYGQEMLYKRGLTGDMLVAELNALKIEKTIPIICDGARPELIETLVKAGYKAKAADKGAGSVLAGITAMQNYKLKIVAGSKNLVKEVENYQWATNKDGIKDEPVKVLDDCCDSLRYSLQHFTKPKNDRTAKLKLLFPDQN